MGEKLNRSARWRSLTWWTSISGLMTAVGTLLAAAGLIIATVAWLKPRSAPDESAPTPGASPSVNRSGLFRTPWLGLEFYRDAQRLAVLPRPQPSKYDRSKDIVEVEVGEAPFELRTPALPRDVGMRVCAWVDDSIFDKVRPDEAITFESPFVTGKGMADSAAGSGVLFLNNDAFNYFRGERGRTSAIIRTPCMSPPSRFRSG
jgi:hypothetical protein